MQEKALFSEAFMVQPSMASRLFNEICEAAREMGSNPTGYIASAFRGDTVGGRRRKMLLRLGLAASITLHAVLFIMGILPLPDFLRPRTEAKVNPEEQQVTHWVNPADFQLQQVQTPKSSERAGGGGGGGRKTPTPPSKGQLPRFSLTPPLIAPRPEPQLKTPSLPVLETVQVDPRLQPKRDDITPTGLPTGVLGPPSAGPGEGGGIGTGSRGGIGSGDGTGVGPGTGFNMGGGGPRLGGGDGAAATAVDSFPVALNNPRPLYTEEARKNKIQGTVRARVLVGADGGVKQVRIARGLPDGLNEEAIRAAYQIRFRPALKNGQPVAYWMPVEIAFTLR
jgi:TonB family protein